MFHPPFGVTNADKGPVSAFTVVIRNELGTRFTFNFPLPAAMRSTPALLPASDAPISQGSVSRDPPPSVFWEFLVVLLFAAFKMTFGGGAPEHARIHCVLCGEY